MFHHYPVFLIKTADTHFLLQKRNIRWKSNSTWQKTNIIWKFDLFSNKWEQRDSN